MERQSAISGGSIELYTIGYISRNAFTRDNKNKFYMLGSMGLLSAVGLGMALNTSREIYVFDGDGSVLMDLGVMAMLGKYNKGNLHHIILDNGCYESTGGQSTIKIDFQSVAKACNHKVTVIKTEKLRKVPPRISLNPEEITKRFR